MPGALLWLFLLVAAPGAEAQTAGAIPAVDAARPVVYVQALGKALPERDVKLVVEALEAFYDVEVRLLPRVRLPRSAYYPPRRRYRAEKLLSYLEGRMPTDGHRILGLTGSDISTTKGEHKDWGVLGLATLDGSACVISSFRCRRRSKGRTHARIRLAKVAVHEIGHTLGLDHCPTRGCLMEDAMGKVATTDREHDLCGRCRAHLQTLGRPARAKPDIPWPRPRGT